MCYYSVVNKKRKRGIINLSRLKILLNWSKGKMSKEILEILLDTGIDALKLLPFLFVTYLIMEYIEHKTGDKTKNIIKKSGKWGPVLGAILGIFPQCGFSAAAANLYAGKVITMGTLIAIFLSTSDEMLPILISEAAPVELILKVLAVKLAIGLIAGIVIDCVGQVFRKKREKKEEKETGEEIGHMCEHEHCHCEKEGIFKSSIKHTLNIFVFIIIISLIMNIIIHFIGEENISNLILNMPVVGPLIAGIVGLIPNCASSVILTQLYLQNVISIGSMIGGLLVGSGIGMLVLFRVNEDFKENMKILTILYLIGVLSGIIIDLIL